MGQKSDNRGKALVKEVKKELRKLGFQKSEAESVSDLRPKQFTGKEIKVEGKRCVWRNDITLRFANGGIGIMECKNPNLKNSPSVYIAAYAVVSRFLDLRNKKTFRGILISMWGGGGLEKSRVKEGIKKLIEKDLKAFLLTPSQLGRFLRERRLA
jgi:hypothetical protein